MYSLVSGQKPHLDPGEDAAFASNIPTDYPGVVCGYLGGPNAYNIWTPAQWGRFSKQRKLPIWVAGMDGADEGEEAYGCLRRLNVPEGTPVVLDMEMRKDITYIQHFAAAVFPRYRVWVYGSLSTVFSNPQCNGYMVAYYTDNGAPDLGLLAHPGVRGQQYAAGEFADLDVFKDWTLAYMWL